MENLQTIETQLTKFEPEVKRRGRPPAKEANCTICGKPAVAKGYCMRHYRQWKRTGKPDARVKKVLTCKLCDKPRGTKMRGYCEDHYNQWIAAGKNKTALIKTLKG